MPRMPFSDWKTTSIPAGTRFATSVGIPMPRLTYIPSRSSCAARATIPSLSSFAIAAPSAFPHRSPLDPLDAGGDDQAVHEDAGSVDVVRVDLSDVDELLHL